MNNIDTCNTFKTYVYMCKKNHTILVIGLVQDGAASWYNGTKITTLLISTYDAQSRAQMAYISLKLDIMIKPA